MSTIRGIVAENDVYDESVVMEKGLTPYILFRFGVGKVESRQEKHSDIPKEHYFYCLASHGTGIFDRLG